MAGALALGFAGLFACVACQDGYPIPASQCDKWCDASQLTFCGNYDPAGCVLTCSQRGGDATECQAELETVLGCLALESPRDLACETWLFTGMIAPCFGEEQNYELCAAPHAQSGFGSIGWR